MGGILDQCMRDNYYYCLLSDRNLLGRRELINFDDSCFVMHAYILSKLDLTHLSDPSGTVMHGVVDTLQRGKRDSGIE